MSDQPINQILVVDDEESCRSMCQLSLTRMGYVCCVSSDATEAMKRLSQQKIDLVISDIRMSGKDGVQFMRDALKTYPWLDFIIMTGYTADYSYSDIVSAGATDYLAKPFEMGELKAKLERIQREKQILKKLQATSEAHHREAQINASLAELSDAILRCLPFDDISSVVIKHAKELTRSRIGLIGPPDSYPNPPLCLTGTRADNGEETKLSERWPSPALDDLWSTLQQIRTPMLANRGNEVLELLGSQTGSPPFQRIMSVPAMVSDTVLGLLVVADSDDEYNGKDMMFVKRLADLYAIAFQRAQSDRELRQSISKLRTTMEEIIQAMALAVEIRDPYTAGHQRRVAGLAFAMAQELGLSPEQTDAVRLAGIIHDLGKINIPAEILSKPGRLTDIEFAMIKTHPEASYNILKSIDFPWPIAEIAFQHHERANGSGYPNGLSGDGILLEARILAVADVVEAMSSHRPYRAALGMQAALDEISRNSKTLYDSEVVEACLQVVEGRGFKFT